MLPLLLVPALVTSAALALGPGAAAPDPPTGPSPAASSGPWRLPIEGALLRRFDPPDRPWLSGHRGVDLGAALGSPVSAAGAGTVTFAGGLAGRGVVVVSHDRGLRTTYEPVDPLVEAGDQVRAGSLLGTVGRGDVHCGRAPRCLHWGLRRGRDYLDPWLLLARGRPVLLPLGGAVRDGLRDPGG